MTTEAITQSDLSTTAAEPDDAELADAEALAERDATGEHVAAFGCRDADRVFLAAVPGQRRRGYTLTIPECPGCGEPHEIAAMPRPRRPQDEIAVSVEPPADPAPADGERPVMKSDPEVLAAIPDDWTAPSEVAEALGYGNHRSFGNRLRDMRRRGAPIETKQAHRTAAMFIRRATQ